jgi:hypothetical protein
MPGQRDLVRMGQLGRGAYSGEVVAYLYDMVTLLTLGQACCRKIAPGMRLNLILGDAATGSIELSQPGLCYS